MLAAISPVLVVAFLLGVAGLIYLFMYPRTVSKSLSACYNRYTGTVAPSLATSSSETAPVASDARAIGTHSQGLESPTEVTFIEDSTAHCHSQWSGNTAQVVPAPLVAVAWILLHKQQHFIEGLTLADMETVLETLDLKQPSDLAHCNPGSTSSVLIQY